MECPECKTEVVAGKKVCSDCGYPVMLSQQDVEKNETSVPKVLASKSEKKKTSWLVLIGLLAIAGWLISTQITIFSVPPIGAVPEGRTLIISRMDKTNFIDSADAMCERIQDGVNLLCRGMALVAISEKATIYLRLPYIEAFYLISTNGKTYTQASTDAAAEPEPIAAPSTVVLSDTPAVEDSVSDTPHDSVVAVVKNWQEIKRNAFVNKDSSELSSVLTGQALADTEGGVNWWSNNGNFYAIELHSLDVIKVEMLTPTQATVLAKISETKDNSVQGRKMSTYEATYTLEKVGGVWRISKIKAD